VGGGGRHKQEGTTKHAPCKERVIGLIEVAWHRRAGGAAAARRVSDCDDASLWLTVTQSGNWGPGREREHDESGPFWLGEGEQRSSPWSKEGIDLSTGGALGELLHGEAPECSISSARGGGAAQPVHGPGVAAL
jgi:hypothetical protein